ncbi:MAG TPA: hypothetical protein VK509_10690 [Polyangiales bacterium]|nr:hypothetical protein [Polyangiales bacterium]
MALLSAPDGFAQTLGALPAGVTSVSNLRGSRPFDVIVFFTAQRAQLDRRFGELVARLEQAGGLWIAWPKKVSGVTSDVSEDVVREIALRVGLVDNKVCAIDDVWSGLRCVIRKEHRR